MAGSGAGGPEGLSVRFEVLCLGSSGTYPAPGAACSGYLLRADGTDVWVDAGPGTLVNLLQVHDLSLEALVLTHTHLDHVVDLYSFYHWIRFARPDPGITGLPVHAPATAGEQLGQIMQPYGQDGTFGEWLTFRPLTDGDAVTVGPLTLSFARTRHPVETYAVRAEAGGRAVVYTADTGPSDEVTAFARGADLLIAEATLQYPDENPDVHMTAAQAGEMASAAGVRRLVLTHIPPWRDQSLSLAEARGRFDGDISLAADRMSLPV